MILQLLPFPVTNMNLILRWRMDRNVHVFAEMAPDRENTRVQYYHFMQKHIILLYFLVLFLYSNSMCWDLFQYFYQRLVAIINVWDIHNWQFLWNNSFSAFLLEFLAITQNSKTGHFKITMKTNLVTIWANIALILVLLLQSLGIRSWWKVEWMH